MVVVPLVHSGGLGEAARAREGGWGTTPSSSGHPPPLPPPVNEESTGDRPKPREKKNGASGGSDADSADGEAGPIAAAASAPLDWSVSTMASGRDGNSARRR